MKTDQKLNMTMLCDFYELTMGNGYLKAGFQDRITYFDVYFRSVPDGGGYAIAAGLDQLIDYIEDLHFDAQDIDYLRSRGIFCEEFLDYLANFHFSGDIYAVPEGTPVFPKEPMVIVRAPAIEAQLLETFALLTINHQSLIATKANRIVRAAKGRAVMEFGSRRAQGSAAAIDGARAAYIAGCCGTACTISDQLYGTPALGTMAHAWVQMFDSEYDAFATYCKLYPQNAVLLVDTYNTLKSGIPNAIKAFNDILKPLGGPSANMYMMHGRNPKACQACKRPSCIHPQICPNLNGDHRPLLDIYRAVDAMPGIKKSFIGSGVRYDLLLHDWKDDALNRSAREYTRELILHHVSGRLKVAPEHTSDSVLQLMRKPSFMQFKQFTSIFF